MDQMTFNFRGIPQEFEIDTRTMSLFAEVCEIAGRLESGPKIHMDVMRRSTIASAQASAAIEANPLTVEQLTVAIDGEDVRCHPRDVREALDSYRCYQMRGSLDQYSLDDLLRAHGVMTEGLQEDSGRLRDCDVGVWAGDRLIYRAPPPEDVPMLMEELMDWLRLSGHHPLIKACVFHFEFESIHPFSDGNGRMGRLWQSIIMSDWRGDFEWVPLEAGILARQGQYYKAIRSAETLKDTSPFIRYMLEIVRDEALEVLKERDGEGSGKR